MDERPLICPVCLTPGLKVRHKGIERYCSLYDVLECPKCSCGITRPFPDIKVLEELYSASDYRDSSERFLRPIESIVRFIRKRRLHMIMRLNSGSAGGRMLDIGCGRGMMISYARDLGWDVSGLELSKETAHHARDVLGLDIRTGKLKYAGFIEGTFDVVTFYHSLEHIEGAPDTLNLACRLLKPGGLLVVSMPNYGSLQAKVSGEHWFHLDVPYHLYHFTKSAMADLLKKDKMAVIKTSDFSLEFNPFGYLQSLLNMAGISHNLLYDAIKTSSLRNIKWGPSNVLELLVSLALLLPFGMTSLIASAVEVMLGMGGTLNIYARKPA